MITFNDIVSVDQNLSDETTTYWFYVDGETYGVVDCNGKRSLVDCDGYPVRTYSVEQFIIPTPGRL